MSNGILSPLITTIPIAEMRSEVLAGTSVVLTGLVLANAWVQRQQFYPSVVYITKSNPSMAVIYLQVWASS